MRYCRTTCHQESHRLQHPWEGNHIGNWSPPPPHYLHLPCLWCTSAMLTLHVLLKGQCSHCHPALCATYLHPLPLPECIPFSRGPLLVLCLNPLPPDLSGIAHQVLCLIQVSLQSYPSEHCHCHRQGFLYPYLVSP